MPAPFSCSEEKKNIRLKSETGTLTSYNYPLPYDANIECIWLIDVDQSYNVKLSFEFFNLSSSSDCSEDYVIVRDGLYSSSDVVGKFGGSNKPQSITSDAWELRVEFKSSGKTKFPGFKARNDSSHFEDRWRPSWGALCAVYRTWILVQIPEVELLQWECSAKGRQRSFQ
ncbi:bone morphogenetic protein 1 homolog isoform X2 [Acropora palmata]|uniref:bone morphogenetic protein 1 homolog isoform X2 n=1 Tax=Acropora palmata TaxID=6131 RepID=UPI003DA062DD